MTQHAHHAARYSAVVALAGALLAPGVTTPATALEDPGQTPDATPAQAGNNVQAQDPAVKVPGEGNERMPQGKVEQPAAKANDTATVAGPKVIKNGQGLEVSGSGWGANAVIAVKYDGGEVKPTRPVEHDGKDLSARGVIAVIKADENGNFTTTIPFPTEANWTVGSEHKINFLSGSLQKGDQKHSATHTVTVGEEAPAAEAPKAEETPKVETPEQPQVKETPKNEVPVEAPKAEETPAQQPQTDEAAKNETPADTPKVEETPKAEETPVQPKVDDAVKNEAEQQPKAEEKPAPQPAENNPAPVVETQTVSDGDATVTGPKTVTHGQGIVVNGSGWSPYSVIAVKYDGGDIKLDRAVIYNGKDYASRGVVAIIQADADGKFTYTLPFPNSDKWGVGTVHDITFLTGSLQKGDEQHSVTLSVTIAGADGSTSAPVGNNASNSGSSYSAGGYGAGSGNNGSGYGSVAPIPTQSSGINYAARQGSITKQASLGAAAELENDTLINRVQARAKAAAKNGSNNGAHAKSAPKKTHTAKAAPGKNGTQGNATTAATQSDSNSAPNIIGAELSGFSRWFANNANNVLLSIAGLIILVLALTFRKRA